jgi:DNA-binding MarR family transcriptional regulator
MNLKEYFLNRKPAETLVLIKKSDQEIFNSLISRKIDTTYSHTVEIVQTLEEQGLIRTEKVGRKKVSKLTGDGRECGEALEDFLQALESRDKEKIKQ